MSAKRLTILDGGTGRELARIGAPFRQPEWSALTLIEAPEYVSQVHQRYIDAGADIITTNSYAVVPFHIGEDRFFSDGERLATLSGQLARQTADAANNLGYRKIIVAGSLPPVCGSYRADLFEVSQARPVLEVLVKSLTPYVDHWQAETLSTISEAELVAELTAHTGKPLWLSFTLEDDKVSDIPRLRSGESVTDAARAALRLGAKSLLFNCCQPEVMAAAVVAAKDELPPGIQVGVYANAFPPQGANAEANSGLDPIRSDLSPEGYATFAAAWRMAGAEIIGGCCGIGPEHIAALAALRNR